MTNPTAGLFEIKVGIDPNTADAANDVLLEHESGQWSVVEDIIERRAWLVGIFGTAELGLASWAELEARLGSPFGGDPEVRALAEHEWRDSYKLHFHAWQFGRLHWVPIWEKGTFALPAGDAVLWLDPGMAFGTGNHETTRLCVERLVEHATRFGSAGKVIDAGCGSGILALSAVRLGFRDVMGFDNDPEAVRMSRENAVLNALGNEVRFVIGDLVSGLTGIQGEIILANILANVLIQFRAELTQAVVPGGTLILSGILAVECMEVRDAFRACVPSWHQDSRTMGEWSDVVLVRPVA